ncbi:MAG: cyclase family protein, partial [Nitrospinae bacterium]|nr:cyclase family protein [Nitrospinota bacterium]
MKNTSDSNKSVMQQISEVVFLSHSLSQATPGYGGAHGFHTSDDKRLSAGDSCNMQKWSLSNHIGTHVDAPRHFFETGPAIDHYPADWWVFHHVAVCAVPVGERGRWIEPDDVAELIGMGDEAALIVTGFEVEADNGSDLRFTALRLVFNEGTAGSDFDNYADEVSIWLGTNEVARVNASDFNDNN